MLKYILVLICFLINNFLLGQSFPSDTAAYYIVSGHPGNLKYLCITDSIASNGKLVLLDRLYGKDFKDPLIGQYWTLQQLGKDNYFIRNGLGKMLDLKDGQLTNGTKLQLWSFAGNTNQRWHLVDAGNDHFYIKSITSGKYIEAKDALNSEVFMNQLNKSTGQKWKFVKIPGSFREELITAEPSNCKGKFDFYTKTELYLEDLPLVSCIQKEEEWEFVMNQQLGISAKSRTNHYIGWSAIGKDGPVGVAVGRNWYPKSDMKKVHIGRLCKVGYFDAVEETTPVLESWFVDRDERDFNLHVLPTSPFYYQINKDLIGFDPNLTFATIDCRDNWLKCGTDLVMEGEITPDEDFLSLKSNSYFNVNDKKGSSPFFINQRFGMYGPWIVEEVHCNHPEIHPCELFWSETTNPKVKYLGILQDDSDRFGSLENFPDYTDARTEMKWIQDDVIKLTREGRYFGEAKEKLEKRYREQDAKAKAVKPWVGTPVSGQFYIAIELDPNATVAQSYKLDVPLSKAVTTTNSAAKIPSLEYEGKSRSLKYRGKELLRISEGQTDGNDIGIRFELFKKENSNLIIGYIVISAAVGSNLDGKEGYMMIKLEKG